MKILNLLVLVIFFALAACTSTEPAQSLNYGGIKYSGGNGKNYKKAILIENAGNMSQGTKAIKHYLTEVYGKQGPDWVMFGKGLKEMDGKDYYLYEIALKGEKKTRVIYFDVTDFWGKY